MTLSVLATNNGKHLFYTAFYQSTILTQRNNNFLFRNWESGRNNRGNVEAQTMHLCNIASDDSDEKCEPKKGSKKV